MKQRPAEKLSKAGTLEGICPSEATLKKLHKLGLHSAFDLILHLPLRYLDETRICPIAEAPFGQTVQVEGEVVQAGIQFRPRRMLICRLRDASGEIVLRFLHFYASQVKALQPGVRVRALGELRDGFLGAEIIHPQYRIIRGDAPLAAALTPVYPTTAGLSQNVLRKLVERALAESELSDTLPREMLQKLALPGFAESIRYLHQPPPDASLHALEERTHPAWRRLKFDELLAQQLSLHRHRSRRRSQDAPRLPAQGKLTKTLLQSLPFPLTPAQQRTFAEISGDLALAHPMQRLLQGDVGSGKTVVAALAACQAVENGFQAAIMAPTEILAEQHYRKLSAWLSPLGVNVAWLTGSLKKKERTAALAGVAEGSTQIAVGTHALFQEEVAFHKLGLAIVDEQHRFGVEQRLALRHKGGKQAPHQLMMSATPIPRTLAMSYYADLDVSVIDELPPGRMPVVTKLVADTRRAEIIARVREACRNGRQAYWVCPLIEESGAGARSLGTCDREGDAPSRSSPANSQRQQRGRAEALQLKTALETFETLRQTFPDLKVGLVHGRLGGPEKAQVMEAFKQGEIQLLVATTVIEVGVDVPNASLMVIEHAERMGLSQLHQLRGRVGRGAAQSACILLYQTPLAETARARLKIIFENSDGFEIARQDLGLRGPGEFLGARQSGVPLLRIADITRDQELLEAVRHAADLLLKTQPQTAEHHLQRWLGNAQDFLKV